MYGQVSLGWNQNPEADLAGYRIYMGTDGVVFSLLSDVGLTATPTAPTTTLTTFPTYGLLYFAVRAYDTSNNESSNSNIISQAVAPKLMPFAYP